MQAALAEYLLTELSGPSEKHTKKLQRTIAKATTHLVRKHARLEAKGCESGEKVEPVAALPTPIKAVLRAAKAAPQPVIAKQPGATTRDTQNKAAPGTIAAGA